MKTTFRQRVMLAALPLFAAAPPLAFAQPVQPPTQAEAQAALNPAPAPFSDAQLDQLLAPIALYPDQLLTQMLMAATFPDQLVDAAKWLQDSNHAALKGDDLANALQPLPWDPSVKSLVVFPQLIVMMTNHLDWTEALGTAFANQEVQTFARVQFLRARARDAGMLRSNSQIAVNVEDSDIIIAPANPDMLYVPVYNPADVYGMWPDADYPPVFLPPPPGFYNGAIGTAVAFSVGFGIVAPLWGWGHPDWHHHEVVVDPGRYQRITGPANFQRNHIAIQDQVWHRTGPVAIVPEAQRPRPAPGPERLPPGTIRPSQLTRPGVTPGAPHGGPAAGPRPAGEAVHPNEPPPGPRPPGEAARPEEAHPGTPPRPEEAHPGTAPRPEERAAPPPGASPRPEEHAAPPPAAPPPHPEEHAAPPPHPEEHAAPPRPEEHAPPPRPEEHAAPPPHPSAPLHPEAHPAPAPHPEAHPAPAPHPAAKPEQKEEEKH